MTLVNTFTAALLDSAAYRSADQKYQSELRLKAQVDDNLSPDGLSCHCPTCHGDHVLDLPRNIRLARQLFQLDHLTNDGSITRSAGQKNTWREALNYAKINGWSAARTKYGLVCTFCNNTRGLAGNGNRCAYSLDRE